MRILVAFGRLSHKVTTLSQNTSPVTPGDPSSLAVSNRKRSGGPSSTSSFVGVSFDKTRGAWKAYVQLATGKRKNVGRAPTAEAAATLRATFIERHGAATPIPRAKVATVTSGEAA